MPFDLVEMDAQLTGFPGKMTNGGIIVGLSSPGRQGWIFRDGVGEFLSLDVAELVPASVNEAGVVVGTVGPRDAGRAFLFQNGIVDLQAELGASFGRARDISDSGAVVGTRWESVQERTAYHYDTGSGTLTAIPFAMNLPDGYIASEAVAVTADGTLAVGLVHKAFSEAPRGFLYDHAAHVTKDLGPEFLPRAINNKKVIGGSFMPSGEVVTFNINTQTFQKRGNGLLSGMNDNGLVVGSMSGGMGAAFLSRPGQPLLDLNTQIPSGAAVRLTSACDVANDGSIDAGAIVIDPATGQPVPDHAGLNQSKPVLLRPRP